MTVTMHRRSFLARLTLAAGAATIAAPGTAVATAIEEDPALLALGERLVPAVAGLRTAAARHDAAVERFHVTRPPLPAELRDRRLWGRDPERGVRISPAHLLDGYGQSAWEDNRPVLFASADTLGDAIAELDGRGAAARLCRRLMPIAERYETDDVAAFVACGVGEARGELEQRRMTFLELGHELFDVSARTMSGIEIKAGAIGAVPLLGKPFEWVAMQWGPKLAANLLTVLAANGGAA